MNIKEMDKKYAELLLTRCLSFNHTDTLLIEYATHENDDFVYTVCEEALKMGVKNISVYCNDRNELHDYLSKTKLEDIGLNYITTRSYLNDAAKNKNCVLHIYSFLPNVMDNIDKDKLKKKAEISSNSMKYYKAHNTKYDFPWVMCTYPNKKWANLLFKDDPDAFTKLYEQIEKFVC